MEAPLGVLGRGRRAVCGRLLEGLFLTVLVGAAVLMLEVVRTLGKNDLLSLLELESSGEIGNPGFRMESFFCACTHCSLDAEPSRVIKFIVP